MNSPCEKEKILVLPLDAWCLGHHIFRHSESASLKLAYEIARQKVKVTRGQSPPESIEFKLGRDVCSAMVIYFTVSPFRFLSGDNVSPDRE